jgi:hypothetical protein
MKRSLTALLLVPLVAGCAKQEVVPSDARKPAFDSVVMHRSACYGPCPVYTVHVSSDGAVAFEGEQDVSAIGQRKRIVSGSALLRLSDAIEKANFVALKEHYRFGPDGCTEWATDNPTVDIIVTAGTSQHHVSYYYGCTVSVGQAINDLSKAIDAAAGTAEWVGARAL